MIGILGGLANLWLSQSYKLSEVSLVTPLKYLALVFAIIFGFFIWDEVPTIKTLLGALLVILSSFIIFRRELFLKNAYQFLDMSNKPKYWNKAKKYLSKKDKVMSSLIEKYKSPSETVLTSRKDIFFHFVKVLLDNKSVLQQPILFF